jgi:DNA-binding beta-propeller fold protein YncE
VRGPSVLLLVLLLVFGPTLGTHPLAAAAPPSAAHVSGPAPALASPARSTVAPPGPPAQGVIVGASLLAQIGVGSQPTHAVWDAYHDYLYATNFGLPANFGNNVSIIAASNNTVVATVPVGDDPINSVYDPATDLVYVLNYGTSCNVTVFNGTSIVGWIPTGCTPSSGIYDSDNGYVYISDTGSNTLSVVGGTKLVATIATGNLPLIASFDPSNGLIFVPNGGSDNVTVLNGSAKVTTFVGTVNVGRSPESSTYDPADGYVYVPNFGTNNISVLKGARLITTVAGGGGPTFVGYNSRNQYLYVDDQGSNSIYMLNGTLQVGNVSVGPYPRDAVYDAADGFEYVPLWSADQIDVFNGTQLIASVYLGIAPYSSTYDPTTQSVYTCVFDANNVSRVGSPSNSYPVTFNESGLPSGANWTVAVDPSNYSSDSATLGFLLPNGSYPYQVPPVPGYRAVVDNGSIQVSGHAPATIDVSYEAVYPVYFNETGLLGGPQWNVTLAGVTSASDGTGIQFVETNGTHAYRIGAPPGYEVRRFGNVSVSGGAASVAVPFRQATFAVTFRESGLSGGIARWGVSLGSASNNSTTGSVGFAMPNGSYDYAVPDVPGYLESPSSGYVAVNGSSQQVRLNFTPIFAVTFTEMGLPHGSNWTVRIPPGSNTTSTSALALWEQNGTYTYNVSTTAVGYRTNISSGQVKVNGSSQSVLVDFAAIDNGSYEVRFSERGLPAGDNWTVGLGGTNLTSAAPTIGVWEPNGSYTFVVSAPGFTATPSTGNLTVDGPISVSSPTAIQFRQTAPFYYPVEFVETGLPSGTFWNVTVGAGKVYATNSTITFDERNGSYDYLIGATPGFVTQRSGSFSISGSEKTVPVPFVPFTFEVTFQESGLPDGTSWSITIGNLTKLSSVTSLQIEEPNGSFNYRAVTSAAYGAPPGGEFLVQGRPLTVPTIVFAPTSPGGQNHGNPAEVEIDVGVLVLSLVVVIGMVVWYLRRRPPPSNPASVGDEAPEPWPEDATLPENDPNPP